MGMTGPARELCGHGSACGKLLLFGEHSAVYGEPAVGLPVPVQTSLDIKLVPGNGDIEYRGISGEESGIFWDILSAAVSGIQDTQVRLYSKDYSGTVSFSSTIPESGGYGSSAALCSACARALSRVLSVPESDIPYISNLAERVFHGTPSGIDAILSVQNGLTAIYPSASCCSSEGKKAFPSRVPLPGHGFFLVSGSVPREKTTRELVAGIRSLREKQPQETQRLISGLGETARSAITLLQGSTDTRALGDLANRAHGLLRELGLSTPLLENIIGKGLALGASGAKLSGAGGGGAFFFVCQDIETAQSLHSAVESFFYDNRLPSSYILPILETGEYRIYERN